MLSVGLRPQKLGPLPHGLPVTLDPPMTGGTTSRPPTVAERLPPPLVRVDVRATPPRLRAVLVDRSLAVLACSPRCTCGAAWEAVKAREGAPERP